MNGPLLHMVEYVENSLCLKSQINYTIFRYFSLLIGGMFTYVSGANFFGEIVEWSGFALACWSLPSLAFATFTALNIGPRAIQHHRYLMNFSAQKFNNLVYACMHAPSCIRKRKILRSHVNTVKDCWNSRAHHTWIDELYKREKIRLIMVMIYLLVWPAVFVIPSCFHCCLSADFISYQNVFVLLCRWYLNKFEDYPKSRRALIPFVLWRPNERTRHKARKERNP